MRMTTSNSFDYLNRLTQKISLPNAGAGVSSTYSYNAPNQRIRDSQNDGSYWSYQYDSLGQVTSGKKYWSDQSPVAGQQFEYAFDDIGNRRIARAGGDSSGGSLRVANYTPNNLNEYITRDIPGAVDEQVSVLTIDTGSDLIPVGHATGDAHLISGSAIYHVLNRGDRSEGIFRDDPDREKFLSTLGEACGKTQWQVHAYCFMSSYGEYLKTPRTIMPANAMKPKRPKQNGSSKQNFNSRAGKRTA